jgi:hypothetical protein
MGLRIGKELDVVSTEVTLRAKGERNQLVSPMYRTNTLVCFFAFTELVIAAHGSAF